MKFPISCVVFFTFYFLLSTFNSLKGQDIHFSQFYNSPLNLSPALIGDFNGEFRFVGNQRTQWRSVTTPYLTYGLSADAKKIYNSPFSTGLSIYQDKAGDSDFSTLQIAVGGVYSMPIKDSSQSINFGIQPTFTNRSINYNKLQFDNQYNGSQYDANLSNGENFNNDGRNYLNLHTGISWNYRIAQRKSVGAGIALFNLLTPKQTFFNDQSIQLQKRYVFHANALLMINDKIDVMPNLFFQTQHKFKEIIIGGQGKYHLNKGDYRAAYAGIWYRNSDAVYFNVGLDYRDFHFGVSYDLNLSSLKVASNYRGGFEFAVIYILQRYKPVIKRYKACPNYI
ncbi:MAG: PorP/SprF family type IX secretion system membrane protein [Vicingus serpentipes]|nr:PorP/SprF family type IX secretion system membrane protein [Vicingus serpentipes]